MLGFRRLFLKLHTQKAQAFTATLRVTISTAEFGGYSAMINMFINGEYIQSKSTHIDNICNPATGEVVEQVVMSTKDDVRMAVEVAREAFTSWSKLPFSQRGEILFKAAHLIKENEKELATSLVKEQGKPMREGMLEIRRFVHTIEHYAGLAKSVRGGYVPLLDKNKYGMIIKKPLGVCGAIVPWNFPVALMGNKIAPGLLAGNTFVVKPANTTPVTATKCIELFQHAGLPKGVLNCVPGTGNEVGEEIVLHPQVAKVGFTGSTPVGKQVMRLAADTVKRVTLELGGSDPMIVCDDADIDRAVSAASVGRFLTADRHVWRSSDCTFSTALPMTSSKSWLKKSRNSVLATA